MPVTSVGPAFRFGRGSAPRCAPVREGGARQKPAALRAQTRPGTAVWDGTEPVPKSVPYRAIHLQARTRSIDGFALFQLCSAHPQLKDLSISASSFNSPLAGQWELRDLEKLQLSFDNTSLHAASVDSILKHASSLYLEELRLEYTGPGFAPLNARDLLQIHTNNLCISGYDIKDAACIINRRGQLKNCIVDVSQLDIETFYKQNLHLIRCRMPGYALSRRASLGLTAVVAYLCLAAGCGIANPYMVAPFVVVTPWLVALLSLLRNANS